MTTATITPATATAARLNANKLVSRRNRLYKSYQAMKGQVCEDVLEKAARVLAVAETQSTAAMMEDDFQQECLAARAAAPAPQAAPAAPAAATAPAGTPSYYDVLQSTHDDIAAAFDAAGYSFFGITLNTMGFGQHCTVSVAPLAAGAKGPKGAETLPDLTANVRTWIAANPIFNADSFGSL